MMRCAVIFLICVFSLWGCPQESSPTGSSKKSTPTGILLITVHGLNADLDFSAFKHLNSLRESALVFNDISTPVPSIRPAITSLMTGLPPKQHKVRSEVLDRFGGEWATLAEAMTTSGRKTLGIAGSSLTSYVSGLNQGFETFNGPEDLVVGPEAYLPKPWSAQDQSSMFNTWMSTLKDDDSWFAWIDFAGLPNAAASSIKEDPKEPYFQALQEIDEALGEMLSAVDRSTTAIILTSTSGMHLEEEGKLGGAYWLDEVTLQIPLWLSIPGADARFDTNPGSLLDVHATIVEIANLEKFGVGRSLLSDSISQSPRMAWTWAPDDEFALPTLTAWNDGSGWVSVSFDQVRAEQRPQNVSEAAWETIQADLAEPRNLELSADAMEVLEKVNLVPQQAERVDPLSTQAQNEIIRLNQGYRFALQEGRSILMQRRTRRMYEIAPTNFGVLVGRVYLAIVAGAVQEAEQMAEDLREHYPNRADTLHWSAHVKFLKGDYEEAKALTLAALDLTPHDADMRYDLACLAVIDGDFEEAKIQLENAIEGGFRNWKWIERDDDLATFRASPMYVELLQKHGR